MHTWESTFDAVPDLIAVVDSNHRITRVNRALAEKLGQTPEELVGQPCCKTLRGLSAKPASCLERYSGSGAAVIPGEEEDVPIGDGFQLSVTPLYDSEGEPAGSVHVFRDLRPLREAESARLREELTKMDRIPLLGLLSVGLAHELNQPLTAVSCNTRTVMELMKRHPQPDPEKAEKIMELLEDIMATNQRAAGIISNMRAIFEGQPPPADNVMPSAIVREVAGLLRSEAERFSISLVIQARLDLPPMRVGRTPILQVLLNLIDNAFDALAAFPDTTAPTVWIIAETEGAGNIRIAVRDNGPGLPPDRLEKIFDPLRSGKNRSMGMGLAICRSLLEAYGGSIRAENHAEGGAQFICTLPIADVAGNSLPQGGQEKCIAAMLSS